MDPDTFDKTVSNFRVMVENWKDLNLSEEERERTRIKFRNIVWTMEMEAKAVRKILDQFVKK